MWSLRIVRFGDGIGLRKHALACVHCVDDFKVQYIYGDREVYIGDADELRSCSIIIEKDVLQNRTYHAVFQRDVAALRSVAVSLESSVDSVSFHTVVLHVDVSHDFTWSDSRT